MDTTQSTLPRRTGRLGPFAHRPFTVYWTGGVLSNLGTWLQAVAGSIYVYDLSGSVLAVGLLNFAGFLPILLFSLIGGQISDRHDRRTVVIVTHAISAVLAGLLAAAAFAGLSSEALLIAVAFALNTSYAIAKPSIVSILPSLVPKDEVAEAVGLNTLQFVIGQISGPIIAAATIATLGAGWAFAINALTFLAPIAAMVYLRRRGLGGGSRTRTGDGSASLRIVPFLRAHLWVIALLVAVVTSSIPLEVVRTTSPALAVESLGGPVSWTGLLIAAQSVGSAIALVAFIPLRRRGWSRPVAGIGLASQALGLVTTAMAASLPVALVGVGLVGLGFSLSFPVFTGALQAEVPDRVRGRIMAIHTMFHLGHRPFTALVVASLSVLVGPHVVVAIAAVLAPMGLVAARAAWQDVAA